MASATSKRRGKGDVHARPGWLAPVAALIGVGVFAAIFLFYYLGPSFDDLLGRTPHPVTGAEKIEITIAGERFAVPANFTRFAAARKGGAQDKIELFALLPELDPYSESRRARFEELGENSRIVQFSLSAAGDLLSAESRFRLHMRELNEPIGAPGPFGLTRHRFASRSPRADRELFSFATDEGAIGLIFCDAEPRPVIGAACSRLLLFNRKVALSYRYQRSYLKDWAAIDRSLMALISSFRASEARTPDGEGAALP